MEILSEEVIKETGLTPEQVSALTPKLTDYFSDQKKEWDKKANDNAEGILSGAANYLQEKTGVKVERQQGEKFGDYVARISSTALESKASEIENLKSEYQQKIKEFKGDDATKAELEIAKQKLDAAQKQLANYEELTEKASKYESASKELSEFKVMAAFGNVKPAFSKEANQYEVKAKWDDFQKRVQDKYSIEIVDGEYIAVDKENHYKNVKLSDLVNSDSELKSITGERVVPGVGSKSFKIEGLNEDVPEEAKKDTAKRAAFIEAQLAKEGLTVTSPEYARRFGELNKKIKES
ncbi:hypothetical protein LIV57_06695 [Chryseobacterium sp. X308]|uniref:hypothetical protein n=1 Tax=Chryseobacterium sp. X308 TaxID=2884873 RepID=UPI001D154CB7|nr:hypothetical protein [Chryseobacterium sp. X308]MCC3214955.1 hypothetical protein [Chryseobacterium sp. X308]